MKKMSKALTKHGITLREINHDILDAAISAYTAYYFYNFNENCEVLGNLEEGFIVLPFVQ